jgi:uncharacterized protein HemY
MEDHKYTRIEDAIEKLTEISSDLNKMLAVHEQRLNQHEKQVSIIEEVLEKRREDTEIKLRDVYDTIRDEDRNILKEITEFRKDHSYQNGKFSDRMAELEKKIWLYMGGLTVVTFLISYGTPIIKLFTK